MFNKKFLGYTVDQNTSILNTYCLYIAGDFILYIERLVILKNKWLRSGKLNQVYGA